ncbi:MAG: penicillin-binding transpeptidase domain-containing protein, partial [Chloroflexota bacterium]|nr:penicillin-binding transpeptidase domain-containing protein [Chloroflexota bacterium]
MTRSTGRVRWLAVSLGAAVLMAACTATILPTPSATPRAVTDPAAEHEAARLVARKFLAAWRGERYERMVELLAPADRDRFTADAVTGLLRDFAEMAGVTSLAAEPGPVLATSLPPDGAVLGPRQAVTIPIRLAFETDRFGRVAFQRMLTLTPGPEGWEVRWRAALLFPELGDDGTLELTRNLGARGQILAADGTVFAQVREDGTRVYPQEWLAGQTIGWASPAGEAELAALGPDYRVGDLVGRSGLEQGAEALLRGSPGYVLSAVPGPGAEPGAVPLTLLERPAVPGADLTITIRPDLQRIAEDAIGTYNEAATAILDPQSGDVWALASAPLFNPNAMVLGTTLAGVPLRTPGASARRNHAVESGYPAGSSFKPFTLLAALRTGVADRSTRMSCNGTWVYDGFTFRNYEMHSLGNSVSLTTAMAFSCNTTYMPLSIRVWDADPKALTALISEFGFGRPTGVAHLAETAGILPDAAYYEGTPRWDGGFRPYGPFDQIQLSIGQGEYLGSALQLANAYAAFANGGTLWVPRLVSEATLPDGRVVERNAKRIAHVVELAADDWVFLRETLRA